MLDRLRFFWFLATCLFSLPVLFLTSLFVKNGRGRQRNIWCRFQIGISGIKHVCQGEPDERANMYIINHRSWLDIILTEAIITKKIPSLDPCWIAKAELKKNIFVTIFIHLYGMIAVQRQSAKGLVKLLSDVKKPLSLSRPIMIFPEGTRSKTDKIESFKAGAKIIAQKNSCLIQPIVYVNTDHCFDTKNIKIRSNKTIKAIFLPLIDTKKEDWYETLHAQMQEAYETNRSFIN